MTRIVMLLILALLVALASWWLWRERTIDACSASKGEWNHAAGFCEPLPN